MILAIWSEDQTESGGNLVRNQTWLLPGGAAALWKGIGPGIHRQVLFGGLRIGLYEPIKDLYVGKDHVGDVPLHLKVAAGLTTGAVGITSKLIATGLVALYWLPDFTAGLK